jgi:hypothetical protein
MSDTISVDFSPVANANPFNAFMQGFSGAHQIALTKTQDEARADILAHPNDVNALAKLSIYDPAAAQGVMAAQDRQRQLMANAKAADFVRASTNAFTPQIAPAAPTAPQAAPDINQPGALPPVAQGASFADAMAPVGQPGQQPVNPQTFIAPEAPHIQQLGAAVTQGADPREAFAQLVALSPETASSMVDTISKMDSVRKTKLADLSNALGTVAQQLLAVPQAQRAAILTQNATYLQQHGVTVDQINQAIQGGLTDQQLQGFIGQAVGVVGMIEQANKQRQFGIEELNAQTGFINAQTGSQRAQYEAHKPIVDPMTGNMIDPVTHQIVYSPGALGESGGNLVDQIIQVEGTGKNPNSSASGIGQFTNGTFIRQFRASFPEKAGMSDKEILAQRGSGVETRMMQDFTQGNQQALQAAGINPSPGNVYAAHILGAGDAIRVLQASPDAGLSSILSKSVIAANPQFKNMTVRGFQIWTNQKMAAAPDGGGAIGGLSQAAIRQEAESAIAAGSLTPLPGMARNKAAQAAITNAIQRVMQERGLTPKDVLAGKAALHADTGSLATLEKQATIVRAAEGAAQRNADLALSLASKVGNGNITIFNGWKNHWNTMNGDPSIAKFAASLDTFVNEYAKVMGGGTPTDSLREHAREVLNTAQSPQQIAGVVATLKTDMENRRKAFESERADTLGRIRGGGGGLPNVISYDAQGNRIQ